MGEGLYQTRLFYCEECAKEGMLPALTIIWNGKLNTHPSFVGDMAQAAAVVIGKLLAARNSGSPRSDGSIDGLEAAYQQTLTRVHELEATIRSMRGYVYAIQDSMRMESDAASAAMRLAEAI